MKHLIAAALVTFTVASPHGPSSDVKLECDKRCKFKRDRKKLRRDTSRHPIPDYIVRCESRGRLHVPAGDGLGGGRYQITESTWAANLPKRRHIRLAGGNKGPIWSSRLLQDIVAANVRDSQGLSAWVCA